MLTQLRVKDFKAVPYLESSTLMRAHEGVLHFSTDKPNVVVGPNGAGKSALMKTLALRFLAYVTGESALDRYYVSDNEAREWWANSSRWGNDWKWLAGLECETDNAPARYYRPGHIPGNEAIITQAMMMGFFEEARAYGRLIDKKSSGQQAQAVMASLCEVLAGNALPETYDLSRWAYGKEPSDFRGRGFVGSYDHQAEVLKALYAKHEGGRPLVMMDEPEQSLDSRAEAQLWQRIAGADCSKLQVIVATHSLFPLLHRDRFNVIEAEPGFADDVLRLTD